MLLFRSSLSGGESANYDSFGVNIIGRTIIMANSITVPPISMILDKQERETFNNSIIIGDNITSCSNLCGHLFNYNCPTNIPDNIPDCSSMFEDCYNFNQPIKLPNNLKNAKAMFSYCENLNQPITNMPTNAQDLQSMFEGCSNFNQLINLPNPVINFMGREEPIPAYLDYMFCDTTAFNCPVTFPNIFSGSGMFMDSAFNQPIDFSNSDIANAEEMFAGCINFNYPVEIYNVTTGVYYSPEDESITPSVAGMFRECSNFNSPVIFNGSDFYIHNFQYMFANSNFNQPIDFSNINTEGDRWSPCVLKFDSTFADSPFNQSITFPYINNGDIYLVNTFGGTEFNQSINIDGDSGYFYSGYNDTSWPSTSFPVVPNNFDQSVNISSNLKCYIFDNGFSERTKLNHPINLPTFTLEWWNWVGHNGCTFSELFHNCYNFNQPLTFNIDLNDYGEGTIYMTGVMRHCYNFNQKITFNIIDNYPSFTRSNLIVNADGFFEYCNNFNPILDNAETGFSFLPDCITDAQAMFLYCTNFNVNYIALPKNLKDGYLMFCGCNHINHLGVFSETSASGMESILKNTSYATRCEILVTENTTPDNKAWEIHNIVINKNLVTELQPISWISQPWGSYNTTYNFYVIVDYNNYVNWTP